MDAINMNSFLLTTLLSRGLDTKHQIATGLAAGYMPASAPLGPLMLLPMINGFRAERERNTQLEGNVLSLQRAIEIEIHGADRATVRVPDGSDVSFKLVEGTDRVTVDEKTGEVTLPTDSARATIAVAADGVVRPLVITRSGAAPRAPRTGGGGT